MTWFYKGTEFKSEDIDGHLGFVYVITDLSTGMKYIGKKTLVSTKRLPPLKGKTRKRVVIKESDWKEYYGSSEEVKKLVEEKGSSNFHREILRLCKSKGEMSYYEMKYQLETDCLLRPNEYHNAFVGGKIHRNHLKGLVSE